MEASPTFDKIIEEILEKVQNLSEYKRMTAAVGISVELLKNGIEITPLQLKDSVKQWFKYEAQKSLSPSKLEELEELTVDDLKYLIENQEELLETEINDLIEFVTLLKNIEDKMYKDLMSDKKYAKIIREVLKI